MLKTLDFISPKWSSLIGRPRLTLLNHKCGNIVCGISDHFKKYQEKVYICKCGYEIMGDFDITQHKAKLYCGTNKCPENKQKMDINCIKCELIRER